jgi:phosphoribosylamine--glycine ligase
MTILIVGGGGREDALVQKLLKSENVKKIYALPGNGGMARRGAICVPIGTKDIEGIVAFARARAVDFAVVAPDDPLVLGAIDALEAAGIQCFGPNRRAAIIEGSKAFAKGLMARHQIPTADYKVFEDATAAGEYAARCAYPIVVKADGLALGKGVMICKDRAEALCAIDAIMNRGVFGESGRSVVMEEFLTGPEVSVLAFTDGTTLVPMVASMDHKRALDGDLGANTGGMGAVAPNPFYTPEIAARCMREIFLPTMRAMRSEGRTFRGCLYFGLMLTADGPKVIEYNCRFGDPEAQVVLPLLKTDLLTILKAVAEGRLAEIDVEFSRGAACCVVLASGGYPGEYETGKPISLGAAESLEDTHICHAGSALDANGALVTSGGRVLGVVATARDLPQAVGRAYRGAEQISFEGAYYRRDIGQRALGALAGERRA